MKISTLIVQLEAMKAEHGDIDVYMQMTNLWTFDLIIKEETDLYKKHGIFKASKEVK